MVPLNKIVATGDGYAAMYLKILMPAVNVTEVVGRI